MAPDTRHRARLGLGVGAVVRLGAGLILASKAGCNSGIFGGAGEGDICGAYGIAIPVGAVLGAVVGRLIRALAANRRSQADAAFRPWPSATRSQSRASVLTSVCGARTVLTTA